MNTKLVKILALSAMTLSLGACGNRGGSKSNTASESGSAEQEAKVVEIDEVLALDADNKFELLGQKIRVENLVLQGNWGLTYVGGAAVGEYVSDLRGLEINAKEAPTFSKGSGWGSDITVEGTLIDVNGRAVVDQATITVNSEREYNEARTSYTGGLPVYMWPAQYMNRSAWDQSMGRKMSGLYFGGQFQVASVPEAITATKGSSFQVVFPGEYMDTEDPDNNSLITVNIPAGIPEAVVTTLNTFIEGLEVGDFVDIDTVTEYDLEAYAGMGIVVERFGGQTIAETKEEDRPKIYTTWAEVADIAQEYFADPLPVITSQKPFTYKVDTSYTGKKLSDLFTDTSWIGLTDIEKAIFVEFNLIAKPSEIYDTELDSDLFREVCADLEAAGFVKDEANSEEGGFSYILTVGERNVAEAVVMAQDGFIDMYYLGDPLVLEFDNFAGAKAVYESRVGRRLGAAFASALIDAPTAGKAYELNIKSEDAYKSAYGIDIYEYGFEISYDALPAGLEDAYEAALLAAGFELKLCTAFQVTGYFKASSGEFVLFGVDKDDANLFEVDSLVFSAAMAAQYITDVPTGYDTMAEAVVALEEAVNGFLGELGDTGTYRSALPTEIAGANFEANVASVDTYAAYYDYGFVLTENIITITLEEGANVNEVYQAYAQALVAAGFAYGYTFNMWAKYGYTGGFWNATSGEYVLIGGTATTLVLNVVYMNAALAGNATYGVVADATE